MGLSDTRVPPKFVIIVFPIKLVVLGYFPRTPPRISPANKFDSRSRPSFAQIQSDIDRNLEEAHELQAPGLHGG